MLPKRTQNQVFMDNYQNVCKTFQKMEKLLEVVSLFKFALFNCSRFFCHLKFLQRFAKFAGKLVIFFQKIFSHNTFLQLCKILQHLHNKQNNKQNYGYDKEIQGNNEAPQMTWPKSHFQRCSILKAARLWELTLCLFSEPLLNTTTTSSAAQTVTYWNRMVSAFPTQTQSTSLELHCWYHNCIPQSIRSLGIGQLEFCNKPTERNKNSNYT